MSVEVGYYRRWWPIYDGVDVTDNIAVASSEFGQFSVVAPTDSRLPNGGGYTINGLYNITPAAAARAADNVRKAANSFGEYDRHWDGFDVTFQARLAAGLNIQGGTSTGRLSEDFCDVRPNAPEGMAASPYAGLGTYSSLLNPYCKQVEPFSTTYKANASYLVPKVDVQVSGTFSSRPGAILRADAIYQANDPTILATLGRPLAAAANVTVPLIAPIRGVRRPHRPGGHAHRQDPAVRQDALESQPGHRQPVQLERQPRVPDAAQPDVAGADAGAAAADLPRQLRHRLVGCRV